MSKSIYSLGIETSDIQAEFERLKNIANGTLPGLQSSLFTKEAFEKLDQAIDELKQKYDEKHGWGDLAKLSALRSAKRDSLYMLAGRNYMTKAALTKKSLAMMHKTMVLTSADAINPN